MHYSITNNNTLEIYCGAGLANTVLRQLYRHAHAMRDSVTDKLTVSTCNCGGAN